MIVKPASNIMSPIAGIFAKMKANGDAIKITEAIFSATAANFANVVLSNHGL